ncbi:MAG: hypothetical protein KME05_02965 [Gloeocapsa sp. UFS-A4-WI-NPMV-4B04]|nr:hypothetical protein [Gloeocapsa sp. UFS-A4-WI-NPMV-4B04]
MANIQYFGSVRFVLTALVLGTLTLPLHSREVVAQQAQSAPVRNTTYGSWVDVNTNVKNLFRISVGENSNDADQSDAVNLVINGVSVAPGTVLDVVETEDSAIHVLDVNGKELTTIDLNNLQPGATFSKDFISVLGQETGRYHLLVETKGLDVTNPDGTTTRIKSPGNIQPSQTINLASGSTNLTPDRLVFSASPSDPSVVVLSQVRNFNDPLLQVETADSGEAVIVPGSITVIRRLRPVVVTEASVNQRPETVTDQIISQESRTLGGGISQTTTTEQRTSEQRLAGEIEMAVDSVEVAPDPPKVVRRKDRVEHKYQSRPGGTLVPFVVKKKTTDTQGNSVVTDNPAEYSITPNIGLNVRGGVSGGKPQVSATAMVPLNRKQGTVSAGLNVTLDPSVSDNRGSTIFSVSPILQINQPLLEEMKDKNNQPIRDRQGNPIMKPKRGGVFYGQLGLTGALVNEATTTTTVTSTPQRSETATRRTFVTPTEQTNTTVETLQRTLTTVADTQSFQDTFSQTTSQTNLISETTTSVTEGSQSQTETIRQFPESTPRTSIVTQDPVFGETVTTTTSETQPGELQIKDRTLVSSELANTTPATSSEDVQVIDSQTSQGTPVAVGDPQETKVERGETRLVATGPTKVIRRNSELEKNWNWDGTLRVGYSNIPNLGAVAKPGQFSYDVYLQASTNGPDTGLGAMFGVTLLDGVERNAEGKIRHGNDRTLNLDFDAFLSQDGDVRLGGFLSLRAAGSGVSARDIVVGVDDSIEQYIAERDIKILGSNTQK